MYNLPFTTGKAALKTQTVFLKNGVAFTLPSRRGSLRPRDAVPIICPGATQALIRRRSLRTIDVPHIGWLQLIDELSEGSQQLLGHFSPP